MSQRLPLLYRSPANTHIIYHYNITLVNMLHDLDVEMLKCWQDFCQISETCISRVGMSQSLLGAILFHFHHLHCTTALKGCTCADQQAAHPRAIHRDCRIVAQPPVHAVFTHVAMSVT